MSTTQARPTLAHRTVERIARRLEPRPFSRRSFLVRTAIVGSVLTVAPLRWALRPTSAYASVCGSGAACSGGWTAFCCTINDGANTCPPGSYVAGWWKIDRSPYCQDAPRYIVDCNRTPGESCQCRCASGTCDERRVCCNNFRYGQCNTQVPGVTEVVCRVVLCTTPWTWDPACGTTLRTDNRTTTHNAPCLPGTNATAIDMHYQDMGLAGSILGEPVAAEASGPRSGAWRRFERGVITWQSQAGIGVLLGAVAQRYEELDGPAGPLGYATSEPATIDGGVATVTRFERGLVIERGDALQVVHGPAAARYEALGGPTGSLGYPTADTRPVGDGRGSVTRFESGAIFAAATGAVELTGPVLARYDELGGPAGSGLGYPTGLMSDGIAPFERGALVPVAGSVLVLRGAIAQRYRDERGAAGPLGALQGDQIREGAVDRATFAQATVFATDRTGARALSGPVLARYLAEGGPTGSLGAPTSDSFRTRAGQQRASFEHGAIEVDASGLQASVVRPAATRRATELQP